MKAKKRYSGYYIILGLILAFVLLEILTVCYRWPRTSREVQSILFFIAGTGISILPMIPVKVSLATNKSYISSNTLFYLLFSGGLLLAVIIFAFCPSLYKKIPIDPKTADMIPILSVMAERYISGQNVYAFIQVSDPMYPIYLPMLWIPFMVSSAFKFDPRWLIEVFLSAGIILTLYATPKKKLRPGQLLVLIPLFMLVWGITNKEITLITMTQEGIVIAYYMFFALVLIRFHRNPYLTSTAITLCLLSRFTLLFFFGFYLLFLWKYEDKKLAYKILGLTSIMVVLIMTIFQAIFHLDIFLGLSANYMDAVMTKKEKYVDVIKYSMGIAKFFKYENLSVLHTLHLVFQIIPLAGAFVYFHYAKPRINRQLFALCIAKLSLVFFFNLLILPYTYLFYTSMLYSIVIFYVYAQGYSLSEQQNVMPKTSA